MEYNYISFGYDCSPATALKNLNLRTMALPFDWVETDIRAILNCISEDFRNFHKQITLTEGGEQVRDFYGIRFPHDYPSELGKTYKLQNASVAGLHRVCADYETHIDEVSEKYLRRIERFYDIINDRETPIIALYRGSINNVLYLNDLLQKKYRRNILFVVSTKETTDRPFIIPCDTERNEKWNDTAIWMEGITKAQQIYAYLKSIEKPPAKKLTKLGLSIG